MKNIKAPEDMDQEYGEYVLGPRRGGLVHQLIRMSKSRYGFPEKYTVLKN